jgi:hypothetical protein
MNRSLELAAWTVPPRTDAANADAARMLARRRKERPRVVVDCALIEGRSLSSYRQHDGMNPTWRDLWLSVQ